MESESEDDEIDFPRRQSGDESTARSAGDRAEEEATGTSSEAEEGSSSSSSSEVRDTSSPGVVADELTVRGRRADEASTAAPARRSNRRRSAVSYEEDRPELDGYETCRSDADEERVSPLAISNNRPHRSGRISRRKENTEDYARAEGREGGSRIRLEGARRAPVFEERSTGRRGLVDDGRRVRAEPTRSSPRPVDPVIGIDGESSRSRREEGRREHRFSTWDAEEDLMGGLERVGSGRRTRAEQTRSSSRSVEPAAERQGESSRSRKGDEILATRHFNGASEYESPDHYAYGESWRRTQAEPTRSSLRAVGRGLACDGETPRSYVRNEGWKSRENPEPGEKKASEVHAPRLLPHVRLGSFKGDSCLETFIAKFDNLSNYLQWGPQDRLFHLRVCLEDAAGQVLWDAGHQTSAEAILKLLRARFGNEN